MWHYQKNSIEPIECTRCVLLGCWAGVKRYSIYAGNSYHAPEFDLYHTREAAFKVYKVYLEDKLEEINAIIAENQLYATQTKKLLSDLEKN